MILTCPFCQTRYLITANTFADGPRVVRCVRCSHSWQGDIPKEKNTEEAPVEEVSARLEKAPLKLKFRIPDILKEPLPKMVKQSMAISAVVLVLLILLWVVIDRQKLARDWPFTEGLYDYVGLHIYHAGEGLGFEHVRSELRFEGGIMRLNVEGQIHNETAKMQVIPDILATAIGSDGKPKQSWQIDAPATKVPPGETVPFQSAINTPEGTVTDVNLSFIETKDDPE